MQIDIQIRDVYGRATAYPINNEAQCLARVAGTKTLTRYALMQALAMGLTVVELDRHGVPCRSYSAGDVSRLPVAA
jgi:hypothetical protein